MSLQALSTELDALIFGYLGRGDKNRLMRVSKSYYKTGEPLLYSEIRLRDDEADRVKLLLITLLERPQIAEFITSFHLQPREGTSREHETESDEDDQVPGFRDFWWGDRRFNGGKQYDLADRLMSHVVMIKDAIYGIRCDRLSPATRMTWFSRVFEHYPHFDGALALILCLATRMTDLRLALSKVDDFQVTIGLIEQECWQDETEISHPLFADVECLCISGTPASTPQSFAPISVGLKELTIENNGNFFRIMTPLQERPCGVRSPFTKLVLDNVALISAQDLEVEVLPDPWMEDLEVLRVTKSGSYYNKHRNRNTSNDYDYSRLKERMLIHTPALKEFIWTKTGGLDRRGSYKEFGSFKAFKHLEVLRIDYDLFEKRDFGPAGTVSKGYQTIPGLSKLKEFFPPSLRVLELYGLQHYLVEDMYFKLILQSELPRIPEVVHSIRESLPSLETVIITINIEGSDWYTLDTHDGFGSPTIACLRSFADELFELGVRFEAWYYDESIKEPRSLLVKPGYTEEHIRYEDEEVLGDSSSEED